LQATGTLGLPLTHRRQVKTSRQCVSASVLAVVLLHLADRRLSALSAVGTPSYLNVPSVGRVSASVVRWLKIF